MSFKICYIWIRKYRNFDNFGVNLSSDEKFDFNIEDSKLTKIEINKVPNDFFGKEISEVTGIIGKNGTGKSNLLELICKLVKGGKTSVDSDFIIITKNEDRYEGHCRLENHINIKSTFPIQFSDYSSDIDNLKVIYFSNVFDERVHIFSSKVSDLSANKRHPRHNWPSKTKTSDFVKQLQFIRSDFFNDSEIPLPKQLIISPKFNIFNSSSWRHQYLALNFEKSNIFSDELKSFYEDIRYLKESKQKLFFIFQFSIIKDLLPIISNLIRDNEEFKLILESNIDLLLNKIDEIKNTYKSKSKIAETWMIWANNTANELFEQRIKNRRRINKEYAALDNIIGILKIAESFEEFFENKNLQISHEGSRNRKTENYILNYNVSTNKLEEKFYNYFDKNSNFKLDWLGLSSGHKAYLNIFSLIRFELKNIKVEKNVLICIDEGDLYLHPKWQADFFYKLTNLIPKFKKAKYQFVLTSHSPFLVSDLPKENLVFLGTNSNNISKIINDADNIKTFGGNLGDLYIDAFFMEGGLISRFAADKIQTLVDKINGNEDLSPEDRMVIDLIGEDLIRVQINNLLNDSNRRK